MLSRRDSNQLRGSVQLSKECNPKLVWIWSWISLTVPSAGEGKYDDNHDIHKLHRWLSDLRSEPANRVEPLGKPHYWNQRLNIVLALLDCVI